MDIRNVEFKAKVEDTTAYENQLLTLSPKFIGEDHQIDIYFDVPHGRLKLRKGNIENALIQYHRQNTASAKTSEVILYQHQPDEALEKILTLQFGIKAIVDKKRKIYFINHVKFHFDEVKGVGKFIEVEVIDQEGTKSIESLQKECDNYINWFGLKPEQMQSLSYSDMILYSKI